MPWLSLLHGTPPEKLALFPLDESCEVLPDSELERSLFFLLPPPLFVSEVTEFLRFEGLLDWLLEYMLSPAGGNWSGPRKVLKKSMHSLRLLFQFCPSFNTPKSLTKCKIWDTLTFSLSFYPVSCVVICLNCWSKEVPGLILRDLEFFSWVLPSIYCS